MKILCVILFAVLGVVVACGSASNKAASDRCTTGSECSSGACLDLAVIDRDGGCSSAGTVCSKPCMTDGDCGSLGAKFKCFDGCGTAKFCGQIP